MAFWRNDVHILSFILCGSIAIGIESIAEQ